MRYLFGPDNTNLLAQLAWTRALVGLDFDGTLAPIVTDRNAAAMRPVTARLLKRVCELYPCVVLSGRRRSDLARRLADVPVERVVSNLGFEWGRHDPAVAKAIAQARERLEAELGHLPGLEIEDKQYSLALHYRRSRRKREARHAIMLAGARLPPALHLISGKLVVHVIHAHAPTKAKALLRLRDELEADTALYVGDDANDEEVFELDQPGRLIGVRIGRSRTSHAAWFLRDQTEIDRLLRELIALRATRTRAVARS
jgi:trehalose 6-phosphate phosphatase